MLFITWYFLIMCYHSFNNSTVLLLLFSFQLYCLLCSNTLHNIKSDQLFILFWNSKWKKIVFDYSRLFYSIFSLFILSSYSFIKIQTTFVIKSISQCCFFLIQYCKMIYFWHVFFRFCNLSYLKVILRCHFCHRMSCMCV